MFDFWLAWGREKAEEDNPAFMHPPFLIQTQQHPSLGMAGTGMDGLEMLPGATQVSQKDYLVESQLSPR